MTSLMFRVKCANPDCTKGPGGQPMEGYAYATDKIGSIPDWYCCKACQGKTKYNERFK